MKENSIFRKIIYAFMPMLLFSIVELVGEIVGIYLIATIKHIEIKDVSSMFDVLNNSQLYYMLLGVKIVLIVVFGLLYLKDNKSKDIIDIRKNVSYSFLHKLGTLLIGIIIAFGVNILLSLLKIVQNDKAFDTIKSQEEGVSVIILFIFSCIIAPIVEELVFRGMLFRRLKVCSNYIMAAVVSSLFFGFVHGNISQGIYGFIAGMYLCYMYNKYDKLYMSITAHALMNFAVFVCTYCI